MNGPNSEHPLRPDSHSTHEPYQQSADDRIVGLQGMEHRQGPGKFIPGHRIPGAPAIDPAVPKRIIDRDLDLSDLELEESEPTPASPGEGDYGESDGSGEAYARFATKAAAKEDFDVIHARLDDISAGLMLARRTGRPLVVHVHSTEFDRSGEHVNQQVYDIERRGMHGAIKVITVSRLTRTSSRIDMGSLPTRSPSSTTASISIRWPVV